MPKKVVAVPQVVIMALLQVPAGPVFSGVWGVNPASNK
jgi:hypothetical protein